jgi:hypothetical protein
MVTVPPEMTAIRRRQLDRIPCAAPASVDFQGRRVRGSCANLSGGGLFFEGSLLPLGGRVVVSVSLPQGLVTAEGEVRYQHLPPGPEGVGIAFTLLPPLALEIVNRYLAPSRAAL